MDSPNEQQKDAERDIENEFPDEFEGLNEVDRMNLIEEIVHSFGVKRSDDMNRVYL